MRELKKSIVVATIIAGVGLLAAGLSYAQRNGSASATTPANYAASNEWPTYGHDSGGMRFGQSFGSMLQVTQKLP